MHISPYADPNPFDPLVETVSSPILCSASSTNDESSPDPLNTPSPVTVKSDSGMKGPTKEELMEMFNATRADLIEIFNSKTVLKS